MTQQGGYVPPNQYNQSNQFITNTVPAVNYNQTSPSTQEIDNLKSALKSNSQFVCCPFCKNQGMTRTERSCSVLDLATFVICCTGIGWIICKACRGKDINCYNASHYCVRCGNKLATYNAC